jgi:hypothetical protein
MAVTVVRRHARAGVQVWDITATADGDTTATLNHAFGSVPQEVSITARQQVAGGLSEWAATSITNQNVVLTKSTAGGSGVAGIQATCIIRRAERHGV